MESPKRTNHSRHGMGTAMAYSAFTAPNVGTRQQVYRYRHRSPGISTPLAGEQLQMIHGYSSGAHTMGHTRDKRGGGERPYLLFYIFLRGAAADVSAPKPPFATPLKYGPSGKGSSATPTRSPLYLIP